MDLEIDLSCAWALDNDGVAAVVHALHPQMCLTCQQPLTARPGLVVNAVDGEDFGYASVHHQRCERPGWRRVTELTPWEVNCSVNYFIIDSFGTERALMVLNPMLEEVLLVRWQGRWRPALHPQFADAGMRPDRLDVLPPVAPGLTARMTPDRIIDVATPTSRWFPGIAPGVAAALAGQHRQIVADVADVAAGHGELIVAVTHHADVRVPETAHGLAEVMACPLTLVGRARLGQ